MGRFQPFKRAYLNKKAGKIVSYSESCWQLNSQYWHLSGHIVSLNLSTWPFWEDDVLDFKFNRLANSEVIMKVWTRKRSRD